MLLVDLSTGGGIGANCHFLEIGPFKVVIDAGMNPKENGPEALPRLDALPEHLDVVIVTHCHLDHLGALPVLMRRYPRTPIMMSIPSMMLARRMLQNSANVMMRQREELARSDLPLFTHAEVLQTGKQIVPMAFGRSRPVDRGAETLEITLHQSGHVAGAASVELEWKGNRILHSGDVLFNAQMHMGGARLPTHQIDTLIMETTRGRADRAAGASREEETIRLFETMADTLEGGGSVLLPVFALGRMQEMLCLLHDARNRRVLPKSPIFAAGLGLDLVNYFDEISRKTGLIRFRRKVAKDLNLLPIPDTIRPGRDAAPGIYLLSSGMMVEHTPSYKVAASILHNPRSNVCMVGYCDPDTPGGQLLATPPGEIFHFSVLDYQTPVRAGVMRFDLSGHADRRELLDYAVELRPENIFLTHGDEDAREWFKQNLSQALPSSTVIDPERYTPYHIRNGEP